MIDAGDGESDPCQGNPISPHTGWRAQSVVSTTGAGGDLVSLTPPSFGLGHGVGAGGTNRGPKGSIPFQSSCQLVPQIRYSGMYEITISIHILWKKRNSSRA